jgi:hypothetical protein
MLKKELLTRTLLTQTAEQMLLAGMTLQEGAVEIEKEMIVGSLRQNKGNLCRVARDLRVHRNTMSRKIHDYGIEPAVKAFRDEARGQRSLPLRKPTARKPTANRSLSQRGESKVA